MFNGRPLPKICFQRADQFAPAWALPLEYTIMARIFG
jgi:hypothetical protein